MDFIKSWQFSVGVAITIALMAIAGIIYGVTTHTEPGWMPGGPLWVQPLSPGPFDVCVHSYAEPTSSESDLAVASYVVDRINDRVGIDLYQVYTNSENSVSCPVNITYGVPAQEGWQEPGGAATLNRDSFTCSIEVSNVTGELRSLVTYHELGHCLGLDHDDFNSSIMRHSQSFTPSGQLPPRFSDFDTDLIRSHYGTRVRDSLGE